MSKKTTALLVIDMQNDFVEGGSLAVKWGLSIVRHINDLMDEYETVVASQDWHPANHLSFASQYSDHKVGDFVQLNGQPQILRPDHCVQKSHWADFVPELNTKKIDHITRKGTNRQIDSYSAFFDNNHEQKTDLHEYLQNKKITNLVICGIATDYCVKATVIDALQLWYAVAVVSKACKAVNINEWDEKKSYEEMEKKWAMVI